MSTSKPHERSLAARRPTPRSIARSDPRPVREDEEDTVLRATSHASRQLVTVLQRREPLIAVLTTTPLIIRRPGAPPSRSSTRASMRSSPPCRSSRRGRTSDASLTCSNDGGRALARVHHFGGDDDITTYPLKRGQYYEEARRNSSSCGTAPRAARSYARVGRPGRATTSIDAWISTPGRVGAPYLVDRDGRSTRRRRLGLDHHLGLAGTKAHTTAPQSRSSSRTRTLTSTAIGLHAFGMNTPNTVYYRARTSPRMAR